MLAPPKGGIALIVWMLAVGFLIGGTGVIWRLIARPPEAAPEPVPAVEAAGTSLRVSVAVVNGFVVVGVLAALLLLAMRPRRPARPLCPRSLSRLQGSMPQP
jgi:hypothetical protein